MTHIYNQVSEKLLYYSIIGIIGDSENLETLDIPLPEEILDIIMANLGEKDLNNLIEVGNERIMLCANRRLKKLLWIKSKFLNMKIVLCPFYIFDLSKYE